MSAAPRTHRRRRSALAATAAAAVLGGVVYGATAWSPATAAPAGDGAHAARTAKAGDPPPDSFWGDTSTIPPAKNVLTVKVLNQTGGKYPDDQVFWTFNGETHSIAEQPTVDMAANSAGRMEFHLGSKDSKYTDFIEFTVGKNQFNGNTTRVDGFGLPIAMRLHSKNGDDVQVGDDYATFTTDRTELFQEFTDAVPEEFKNEAKVNAPYSIPAPGSTPDFKAGGKYADYFADYAKKAGIDAPTSDIFGCAGKLAGDPDNCAALNRHIVGLSGDDAKDPKNYYKDGPANYYAKFWHDHGIKNLAYGFPYDDVNAQSSFVTHDDPQWLEVAVGF